MTALTAGGAGFTPHGASELKTGARALFSRGLAGSSAVHFLLLALFLAASGTGERVLRTYDRRTDLIPVPTLPVPPPIEMPRTPTALPPVADDGTIVPAISAPKIDVRPVKGTESEGPPVDGGPAVDPADGARRGVPPGGDDGPTIYENVDQLPVPTVAPKPVYPPWAVEAGVTGRVLLHVLVGADGRVRQVVVKQGVSGLSEAARDAVLLWVFRPATVNGVAVSTWVSIPVVFRQ